MLLAAGVVALCFLVSGGLALALPLPSRTDFNVVRWELFHIPNKWLYLTGRTFRGKLSNAQEDERLGRYLVISAQIDALQAGQPGADTDAKVARLKQERSQLAADVEAILEGRITSVLEGESVQSSLPLFPKARWVFPPVDTELEAAPNELAISLRDRIQLIDERPLSPTLSAEEINAIEQQVETDGRHSALIEPLGGVATYPSIVAPVGGYRSLVELAAHEWTHQYLFFKPLGSRVYASLELRTLNETVATIAGQQLAAEVVKKYPLPADVQTELNALRSPPPPIDVGAALRSLRGEVDKLLAQGQVTAAETLMEQRRQELGSKGVYFRKINQAFFAFENIYATSPASTDPIGGKIVTLLAREGSIGAFLRASSQLTSAGDLDRLLAATAPGGTGR